MKGCGWYLTYISKALKYYPQFSLPYIEEELPMALGWALICQGIENDGFNRFCGLEVKGKTYLELEIDDLVKQAKDFFAKGK